MEYSVDVVLRISVREIKASDFNNAESQAKSLIYKKFYGQGGVVGTSLEKPRLVLDEYRADAVYKREE